MTLAPRLIGTVEYMAPNKRKGNGRPESGSVRIRPDPADMLGADATPAGPGRDRAEGRMQRAPRRCGRSTQYPGGVDALGPVASAGAGGTRPRPPANSFAKSTAVAAGGAAVIAPLPGKSSRAGSRPSGGGAGATLLAAAGLGAGAARQVDQPAAGAQQATSGPTITLAILPFRNASGDTTLDALRPSLSMY